MMRLTQNELDMIVEQAKAYIDNIDYDETFEVEVNGYIAVFNCHVNIGEDPGDYWTAPAWWVESVDVDVKGVYGEDGKNDFEAARYLYNKLN